MSNEEPRRSKRSKVMSDSGQTDAERRELRIKQRALKAQIADERSELSEKIKDVASGKFQSTRKENNILYEDVNYTREAVLDSENLQLISQRAARQVDKLMEVARYDVSKFVSKLRKKCAENGSHFNWKAFGFEVGSMFNCTPSHVSFMNGPINAEYEPKQRKKSERRKRKNMDDVEEVEVGNVQQKKRNKDEDKLSAAEKQVTDIKKLLDRNSEAASEQRIQTLEEKYQNKIDDWTKEERREFRKKEKDIGEVPAVQFLFNPHSFTQTVENIFGLSFLVKKGDAKIGVRTKEECTSEHAAPGLFIKAEDSEKVGEKSVPTAKQAIVSLSMADWKAMVNAYDVEQSVVPHRGKSKYGKKAVEEDD